MTSDLKALTLALELSALIPCAVITLFLLARGRHVLFTLLPALYFLSLGSQFLAPVLVYLFGGIAHPLPVLMLQNLLPELTFLLILQFITGAPPRWHWWLILALPLIGGWPLLRILSISPEICFDVDACVAADTLVVLYRVIGGSIVFLLLVAFMQRRTSARPRMPASQYWLIVSIIGFSLLMLVADLLLLSHPQWAVQLRFTRTMLGLGFIYLVFSSIFRVFHPKAVKPQAGPSKLEQSVVEKILHLLSQEHVYRDPELSRRTLAAKVRVPEHLLSKLVNQHFRKSVTELIQDWRIEDAKARLSTTKDSITNVAMDAGFSSIASFNRVFKARTGMAASAYRKHST